LSLYGTENKHVSAVNTLIGGCPPANVAFDTLKSAITADQALAAAALFLASTPGDPPPTDPGLPTEARIPGGVSTSG
jgi:hypothetical protein